MLLFFGEISPGPDEGFERLPPTLGFRISAPQARFVLRFLLQVIDFMKKINVKRSQIPKIFSAPVDVCETIRNPFEFYAYLAARGRKYFSKFGGNYL